MFQLFFGWGAFKISVIGFSNSTNSTENQKQKVFMCVCVCVCVCVCGGGGSLLFSIHPNEHTQKKVHNPNLNDPTEPINPSSCVGKGCLDPKPC